MKVIVNALGYSGQGDGAGGAGVFLQYLVSQLPEHCDVDVLVAPQSKAFQGRTQRARLIELPYLTAETLGHLRAGPTVVLDPYGGLPCGPFPDDIGLCVIVHDLSSRAATFFCRGGASRSLDRFCRRVTAGGWHHHVFRRSGARCPALLPWHRSGGNSAFALYDAGGWRLVPG